MADVEKKVLKLGLMGAGGKLWTEGEYIHFLSPYGKAFQIRLKDIQIVNVDRSRFGKDTLEIIGGGVGLAAVKLPRKWADEARDWILAQKG